MSDSTIDLGKAKRETDLNESFLATFGFLVKSALKRMFGYNAGTDLRIKGTRSEIETFMDALHNEKKYMQAYKRHGLTNPTTLRQKHKLDFAVSSFEKETGLKWPFK
tara:strand:- start:879 stop:1199 length:321 start_codon:yes stop_codon:yes gene_type:complete